VGAHLKRLLEPVAACLSREVAAKIADLQADEAIQSRIDYLADRANDGLLTDGEREEYSGCLQAIDVIAVLQAKARSLLLRKDDGLGQGLRLSP
jgi:hypothetical protein